MSHSHCHDVVGAPVCVAPLSLAPAPGLCPPSPLLPPAPPLPTQRLLCRGVPLFVAWHHLYHRRRCRSEALGLCLHQHLPVASLAQLCLRRHAEEPPLLLQPHPLQQPRLHRPPRLPLLCHLLLLRPHVSRDQHRRAEPL